MEHITPPGPLGFCVYCIHQVNASVPLRRITTEGMTEPVPVGTPNAVAAFYDPTTATLDSYNYPTPMVAVTLYEGTAVCAEHLDNVMSYARQPGFRR